MPDLTSTDGAATAVTVKIENTYECGRTSESTVTVPPPAGSTADDIDTWWENVVYVCIGDGHPCGATENALYDVEVLAAPTMPELIGTKYEMGG